MTFSTILGVTEKLCSCILVLEGKTGKEIPDLSHQDESSEKSFQQSFTLSDAEENTPRPLN